MYKEFSKKIIIKLSKISRSLENSSISLRRSYQVILDIFILIISTIFSFYISNSFSNNFQSKLIFCFITIVNGLLIYFSTGQYKGLTKYRGSYFQYFLIIRNTVIVFLVCLFYKFFNNEFIFLTNNYWILLWLILNFLSGGSRIIIRDIILNLRIYKTDKIKVLIYGAGDAGSQLAICFYKKEKRNSL